MSNPLDLGAQLMEARQRQMQMQGGEDRWAHKIMPRSQDVARQDALMNR